MSFVPTNNQTTLNAMKLLNLQKTYLQGKSLLLLLSLLFSLFAIDGLGQSTTCKSDFEFDIDHESLVVKFRAKSSHSPVLYKWEFSDGTTDQGQAIRHQFSSPGEYKVCLTTIAFNSSTNQRCTTRVCKAVEIVDCDRLKAEFKYEISGLNIRVKGESNSQHAVYGFTFGDGSSERGQSASHTYAKPGVYALCFYAKDTIYGCVTEVCKRVLIDPCDLRAKFDYRQDGSDFKFIAKSNDSNSRFIWDFGDGSNAYGDEVKHSYQRPGTYIVCLKVVSKTGAVICDFKTCERVQVPVTGCDLEAKFDFRQSGKDFKFFAKSSEDTARYVWDFGDGTHGYGQEVKHSYGQTRNL